MLPANFDSLINEVAVYKTRYVSPPQRFQALGLGGFQRAMLLTRTEPELKLEVPNLYISLPETKTM